MGLCGVLNPARVQLIPHPWVKKELVRIPESRPLVGDQSDSDLDHFEEDSAKDFEDDHHVRAIRGEALLAVFSPCLVAFYATMADEFLGYHALFATGFLTMVVSTMRIIFLDMELCHATHAANGVSKTHCSIPNGACY